jgi:branched-chain amino acid transport system ATP-binding protein
MLEVGGIEVRYGNIVALEEVSFRVNEGEIVTLIGANGAGKTTSLRAVSGLLPLSKGDISFEGRRIDRANPEDIVRLGIAHSPEGRRVFPGLTAHENIMLGASNRSGISKEQIDQEADAMFDLFSDIRPFQHVLGWTLSGGQQQMVAVARGLMAKPKLLLLDEPSLGLAPVIVSKVFDIIKEIRRRGTTVLLVEQNARMGLSVADRGYVLETGRLVVTGKPDELWNNEDVRAAYLGGHARAAAKA